MKISLGWVKDLIDINASVEEISQRLTASGLEVEGVEEVESIKGGLKGVVLGEVLTCEKHPDADKLSKTTVDLGDGNIVPIVCGAPNVAAGQRVVVATVGATLFPDDGEGFTIKKAKIRGEVSEGMICAEDELGLGKSHDGIMVLATDLPNGTPAAKYFNIESDFVYEIGLTPNRADAASHYGVARELKALFGATLQLPNVSAFTSNGTSPISVKIENATDCPRYAGLLLENITVAPSPEWLQNRLRAVGVEPINNVVDVTNYVLHGLGQPMHAFDAAKITSNKVVVKTVAAGTAFKTLDDVERKLTATDLMICNDNEPMCIAGVFGGAASGISATTTRVFLESAYFHPDSVRKTSLQHGLKTDASFRFERGTDVNMVPFAIQYAAVLLQEIAGAKAVGEVIDVYPTPIDDFKVEASYSNINRLIGKALSKEEVKAILVSLDIKIEAENEAGLSLVVPSYRVDVQREADIIEEVLRIYGYDNVALSDHMGATFLAEAPENNIDFKKELIGNALAGSGFNEIITNSLTKAEYAANTTTLDSAQNVEILNRLSEELGVMRQSLLHSGLEVLARNINRKEDTLRCFEFGKTYHKLESKYKEVETLSLFITGKKAEESWLAKPEKVSFDVMGSVIVKLFEKLSITNTKTEAISNDVVSEGINIIWNNKVIGFAGLVSKKQLKITGIKQTVMYAEFDLKSILKKGKAQQFDELSKFPKVRRDLSLVLDKKVSYQEIEQLAKKSERNLLKEINVFDIYEGENLGEGKKSYSVSFMLQDNNQTLTDKVIDKTMERLIKTFEQELGAVIRK